MRSKPYIGITGVRNADEAAGAAPMILRALSDETPRCGHRGEIGVQVTDRTLRGLPTANRRCPDVTDVPDMFKRVLECEREFRAHGKIMTAIHYTTKEPKDLFRSVRYLLSIGDMYDKRLVRGLQLNGGFERTPLSELQEVRNAYPAIEIIQQIPVKVLNILSAEEITKELKAREEYLNYVLIDPSGGLGKEMDVAAGSVLARAIIENTSLAVGFAGGLKGGNIGHIICQIAAELGTKDFSIDAEGGLRDRIGEGYGNDLYNSDKANDYFLAAAKEFGTLCVTVQGGGSHE